MESDTTLSQVVSLSRRYHPYGERSREPSSRQSTLGCSKQQFFRKGPAGKVGFRQGNTPTNKFQHKKRQPSSTTPKLLPGTPSFQDGWPVYAAGSRETRVANGKDRSQGCIPDNSGGKGAPLPAIFSSTVRRMDTVSVPPIRTLHRTLCIHEDDQAHSAIPTPVRHPLNNLSG